MRYKSARRTRRKLRATDALEAQILATSNEIEARRLVLDLQFNRLALIAEISSARAENWKRNVAMEPSPSSARCAPRQR